MSSPS